MRHHSHTWECPYCHLQVTCLGVVEGHSCPANKSRWVPTAKWMLIEDERPDSKVRALAL